VAITGNTVAADGSFTLKVANPTSYTAPFILRADPTPANPSSGDEHYSIFMSTLTADTTYRVNITPITSLMLYEATKKSLVTVFNAPQTYIPGLTTAELVQAENNIKVTFPALNNLNFLGQSFAAANGDAYDDALDAIDFVTLQFGLVAGDPDAPTLKDGAGVQLTYDDNDPLYPIASVSVVAGSATQTANNTSFNLISASVTDSQGHAAKNVTVNFTTTAGGLWTTNSALTAVATTSAVTDVNGVARLYLKAPTVTGIATITAASSDNAAEGSATVSFVSGAPAAIGLSAQPSELAPGTSTSLTAIVTDANGNLVADGESIRFSFTTAAGAVGGNFSGAPIVNRTTANGVIILSYTAGTVAGIESIVATSTNGTTRTLPLTLSINASSISSLALTSSAATIPANGTSTVTLTATARNSSGLGVPGAVVTFSTSTGTLIGSTSVTTNANGVATATLKSGTSILTATANASVNGYTANVNVGFTAGSATVIGSSAAPSSVRPGGTSIITVAVLDGNGNPVSGEQVAFTLPTKNSGITASLSAANATTNASGLATVTYTAGNGNGSDTARATLSNGTTKDTIINVNASNAVIGSLSTMATNPSIPVTVGSTIIRATVRDSAGLVLPGITVNFTSSAGTLVATGTTTPAITSAITDANGIAALTLIAGSNVLTASVEASANGFASIVPVNFIAGSPDVVSVSAAPNAVNPGVSSTISAFVTDLGGNPVVGETVTFSIPTKGSGLPTLALTTAVTNANGLASVAYTAGAGTGTDSVSVLTSNGKTGTVAISVSPANVVVGSVSVVANSATIPVTGSTVVRATVRDTSGQVIPSATVTFSSSAGTFNPLTATTDVNGLAQATLTAGTDILIATIRAETGGVSGNTQVSFTPGAATTVSVNASPNAVKRGGTSSVTIAVVDGNGNPVAGEPVAISLPTHGSGTPTLNLTSGVTNANGLLVVTYTGGAVDGIDSVKAVASTGAFNSASITVNAATAVVATVNVAASNANIPVSSGSTSLNATVLDSANQPLPGISVTFSTTGGTFAPAAIATTNASGVATVTLTAGANIQAATISATASNVSGSATVNFTAGAASSIGANASPSAVKPGGTSALTLAVVDGNGNAVVNETVTLTFDTRGSGTPSLSAVSGVTNANGLLIVTYTAGLVTGSDTIRARTSNGFTTTAVIGVSPANTVVGSVDTSASNGSIPVTTGTTVIRALVKDSAGLVVPGVTVAFSSSAGVLSAASAVTDANGIASVTLTAGAQVLSARIEATTSGVTNSTNVSFTAGAPNTVTMNAAPSTVNPGVSSTISAYVVDASLNPVAGETVTFSIPTKGSGLPTLALTTAVTNANGLASVTYTAGAGTGTDTVSAVTSNSKSGTANITVSATATVVGSIALVSGATSLPADGASTATLRATVLSSSGAPVSGVSVNFTTSGGSLSPASSTTNASGIAEVTLTSPNRTGTITVIAEASGFLDSQDVTIVAASPSATKFVLSASPGSVNAGGISALTAIVLDANDNPVVGQTVTFTITTNSTGGSIAPVTATTSTNGIATASYTGGNTLGTDTIRAALVGGLTTTTTVQVNGNALNALSIGTDKTTVKSDNSETAFITVTALSSQNVVVPGVTISFTANGGQLSPAPGQLSASQVVTNASGQASVNLTPGTLDKSNRTVTVSATAVGVAAVLLPVRVVDSTVTLTTTSTTLTAGGANATVTVTARDASGLGIYNVPVTLTQSGAGTLINFAPSGNTDVNGQFTTTVSGSNPGSATLSATALGATATQTYTVLPGTTFAITAPATDPVSMSTGGTLVFSVNAPTQTNVRFATTIGTWSVCPGGAAGTNVCTATVAAGTSTATLTSAAAGIASVQVDGLDGGGSVTGTDGHTVAITSAVAASVTLQASAANVQPSTGGALNTVTLIATLRDAAGQPVGNVPVAFSLVNTTGGGETLSPVIKLSSDGVASTDPLGQARSTFTSGSLPSGQTSTSIQIQATAVGSAATPATVNIVIGGTAGSVVIGQATHFTATYSETAYTTPMIVQVADSNGNPVPGGTVVSLSVWPTHYSQGRWRVDLVDATKCTPYYVDSNVLVDSDGDGDPLNDDGFITNEDVNENLILNSSGGVSHSCNAGPLTTSEDKNCDGSLTPANSTAGTLPSSVVTDANGLVNFNLVYLKQYAAWINVRVRATALVQGTEATGNLSFTLPWLRADSTVPNCVLPNSPFN
jgi:adhesin/invasin